MYDLAQITHDKPPGGGALIILRFRQCKINFEEERFIILILIGFKLLIIEWTTVLRKKIWKNERDDCETDWYTSVNFSVASTLDSLPCKNVFIAANATMRKASIRPLMNQLNERGGVRKQERERENMGN